jgi:hypothetical protein
MDCKTSAVGLKAEKVPYPDFAECSVCGFRLLDPQRLPKLVGQQKTHYYGLVSAIEREIGAAKQEGREPVFNGDVICFCPGCEKGRPFRIHKARQAN